MVSEQVISRRLIATRARLVLPGPTPSRPAQSTASIAFFQNTDLLKEISMTDTSPTNSRRIVIFDTTLRDGEQSPGASMNLAEKMEVAQALLDLGVDVIEAGFPIASPGDFEAVREIARRPRRARSAAWPAASRRTSTAPGRPSGRRAAAGSTSSSPPAPSTASSSSRWPRSEIIRHAVSRRPACGRLLSQRRVLARRRRPHRARFPLRGRRSGHRRRRHDRQHSRHRRLRHPRASMAPSSRRSATACRTSTRR